MIKNREIVMYKVKFFLISSIVASILAIGLVSYPTLVFAQQELGSAAEVRITLGAADDGNFEPFAPTTINVMPGSTVSWTNDDSTEHTVTANDNGLFDSGPIPPEMTWDNTFDSTGIFGYHCSIHPWMTGRVMVG
jgi:plastocyanin